MKFKKFLKEMEGVAEQDPNINDTLRDIKVILASMSPEEINEVGQWLYQELFDNDDYGDEEFDYSEIIEMLDMVDSEDLQYVKDTLMDTLGLNDEDLAELGAGYKEYCYDTNGDGYCDDIDYDDEIGESFINEVRFFKKTKKQLDKEKRMDITTRRKLARKRKLYYKRNKAKIKRLLKKYRLKVKRNPNKVRHHRGVKIK